MTKKIFKIIGFVFLAIVILAGALLAWLSIAEYKPADVEDAQTSFISGSAPISADKDITVLTWNIGYSGLGAGSDFFMDGGDNVKSADKDTVNKYLSGISKTIKAAGADVCMLQEVDENSSRSYNINEKNILAEGLNNAYALNYSCPFVPYPLPPIGKVNSGLLTTTDYAVDSAQRITLPCPFSWPMRTANLKRCLLASYLPVENSDKYLVIVNLHLEAYDDGEGKIAQTNALKEFIADEYAKGNYVIAGGDFNQEFPGCIQQYPIKDTELWAPGSLEESMIPEGWSFAYDKVTPSCRLLNQPYEPDDDDTQYYIIDGFILSPNVKMQSVETLGEDFANSDHNPVRLTVALNG